MTITERVIENAKASAKLRDHFAQHKPPFGLSISAIAVLKHVADNPGISPNQATRDTGVTSMNYSINALEAAGLVFVGQRREDRRSFALQATPQGLETLKQIDGDSE